MDEKILIIADQFSSRVEKRLMRMNLSFSDLCIKAEPASLVSAEVPSGSGTVHLENAADVVIPEWNQFLLAPHEGYDIGSVATGVLERHPEFRQEMKLMKKSADKDDMAQVLYLTVPEVDKARHDVLLEGVKTLTDAFNVQVDSEAAAATVKIAPYLLTATKEDQDEAKKMIADRSDDYKKQAGESADRKKKEIEEAYQKYLEAQAERQSVMDEAQQALNPEVTEKMKMPS